LAYLGLGSIYFLCFFWHPEYTDPGRFGWRGAEGAMMAVRAVSGEEAEAEVKEVQVLVRGSGTFR
jgi:hypothetical protein